MKKLMLTVAATVIAGMVQAAAINWGSGALARALSEDGGWGTKSVFTGLGDEGTLRGRVFLLDTAEDYAAAVGMNMKSLYETYNTQDATASLSLKASSVDINTDVNIDPEAQDDQTYWAVVLYDYTDIEYGDMYLATTAEKVVEPGELAVDTLYVTDIGSTVGAASGWQAVPEPTSGLLLLVGGALLALKRKRA